MAIGKKTGGGSRKGKPNKVSKDIAEKLAELDCDPIQGMAEIAAKAKELGDMALAGQMYKELAQYVAPKRKAVEMSVAGEGGGPMAVSISINQAARMAREFIAESK
jgi:hypothetical protein